MSIKQKTIKALAIALAIFIISVMFFGVIWIISLFTNHSDKIKGDINKKYSHITSINLETSNSNITIKYGDVLKIETIDMEDDLTIKETGKKLILEEEDKWFFNDDSGEIIIYVPIDIKLDELEIESKRGVIIIDGISAYDFDIDAGTGRIEIFNSSFDKTDINGGAGSIEITNSILKDLELDSGVGRVDITAKIIGNSSIDCGIGEINLTLLDKKEEYKLVTNKGIGKITVDDVSQKDNTTYGDGFNKIEINGGIGSININFAN